MTSTNFNVGMSLDRASSKDDKNSTSSDSEGDEDYVPSSKELKDDQEASEENTDDSENEVEGGSPAAKRGRTSSRRKKRVKLGDRSGREQHREEKDDEDENEDEAQSSEKSISANIDDLWNDFKKDVQTVQPKLSKPTTTAAAAAATVTTTNKTTDESDGPKCDPREPPSSSDGQPKTKTVTEIFEFAGEAVEVQKEVPIEAPVPVAPVLKPPSRPSKGGGAGLSSILGQIGKKQKLSVLEKSKLDWDTFKRNEGIQEDLQTHNRGKEGYLEKQDFLQRTDLRQFELEKAMRANSRRSK